MDSDNTEQRRYPELIITREMAADGPLVLYNRLRNLIGEGYLSEFSHYDYHKGGHVNVLGIRDYPGIVTVESGVQLHTFAIFAHTVRLRPGEEGAEIRETSALDNMDIEIRRDISALEEEMKGTKQSEARATQVYLVRASILETGPFSYINGATVIDVAEIEGTVSNILTDTGTIHLRGHATVGHCQAIPEEEEELHVTQRQRGGIVIADDSTMANYILAYAVAVNGRSRIIECEATSAIIRLSDSPDHPDEHGSIQNLFTKVFTCNSTGEGRIGWVRTAQGTVNGGEIEVCEGYPDIQGQTLTVNGGEIEELGYSNEWQTMPGELYIRGGYIGYAYAGVRNVIEGGTVAEYKDTYSISTPDGSIPTLSVKGGCVRHLDAPITDVTVDLLEGNVEIIAAARNLTCLAPDGTPLALSARAVMAAAVVTGELRNAISSADNNDDNNNGNPGISHPPRSR